MSVSMVWLSILVSGLAGGIGGAFVSEEFVTRPANGAQRGVLTVDWWMLIKRLVLGVLAAFVVPLFLVLAAPGQTGSIITELMSTQCPANAERLQEASSDLIKKLDENKIQDAETLQAATAIKEAAAALNRTEDKIKADATKCIPVEEWWNKLLILIGFCIIAALAAQRFLGGLAEKILKEVKEDAGAAREAATAAQEQSQRAMDTARNLGPDQELDPNAVKLLKTFATIDTMPASTSSLAGAAGLDPAATAEALEDMRDGGLVAQKEGSDEWFLRGWGKLRLRGEVGLTTDERRVLAAIAKNEASRPTAKALSDALSMTDEATAEALQRLDRIGLVSASKSVPGGWRLRSWGKTALEREGEG